MSSSYILGINALSDAYLKCFPSIGKTCATNRYYDLVITKIFFCLSSCSSLLPYFILFIYLFIWYFPTNSSLNCINYLVWVSPVPGWVLAYLPYAKGHRSRLGPWPGQMSAGHPILVHAYRSLVHLWPQCLSTGQSSCLPLLGCCPRCTFLLSFSFLLCEKQLQDGGRLHCAPWRNT